MGGRIGGRGLFVKGMRSMALGMVLSIGLKGGYFGLSLVWCLWTGYELWLGPA